MINSMEGSDMTKTRQQLLEDLRTAMVNAGVRQASMDYFLDEQQTRNLTDQEIQDSIDRYKKLAKKKESVDKKIKAFPDEVQAIADRIMAKYELSAKEILADVRKKEEEKYQKRHKKD
jgi:hypothetical protein